MNMAKTQDLPLNPSKVSGVCGRLLCCLSYENDQYKQQKNLLPKLGQPVQTPMGDGMVISLQVLRELVTVRYQDETPDQTFTAADLGFQQKPERTQRSDGQRTSEGGDGEPAQRRRRRRGRGRGQAQQPEAQV
jgi:cell fate regulator YaaT (PSP1 superfamily)